MSAMTNGTATENGNGGLFSSDEAYDDEEKLILAYRRTLKFYKGLRQSQVAEKAGILYDFSLHYIILTENEGKSVQLHYPDKIRLVALTQQAYYGKYAEDKVPPLGAFDVIGKDRRYE